MLAPDAVIPVDEPLHIDEETGVTVRTGSALTVIAWVAVLTQPDTLVPVIVYVVVAVALQVTVAPVDALRPVAGDQL